MPSPKPRNRNDESALDAEAQRILAFVMAHIEPAPGQKALMQDIFKEYQEWLSLRGFPETVLTIDGFGRMFPRTYPRRVMLLDGVNARGVLDIRVRPVAA